ncbi:hypothetical protein AAF712_014778 [Marasmius tenuissimus]|uniref:Uncharacterized protein n=1 Tax=Marasmius tenuissimus TaxID=585030 RepID=A0ABR2ZB09_9AGAR
MSSTGTGLDTGVYIGIVVGILAVKGLLLWGCFYVRKRSLRKHQWKAVGGPAPIPESLLANVPPANMSNHTPLTQSYLLPSHSQTSTVPVQRDNIMHSSIPQQPISAASALSSTSVLAIATVSGPSAAQSPPSPLPSHQPTQPPPLAQTESQLSLPRSSVPDPSVQSANGPQADIALSETLVTLTRQLASLRRQVNESSRARGSDDDHVDIETSGPPPRYET